MKRKGLLVILFITVFALFMSSCGGGPKLVLVTAITVIGEDNQEIVFVGETLQMEAQIEPANASNKAVIWTVENAAGDSARICHAEITQEGAMTGLSAGTVLVKAIAKDSSEVEGTKEITVTEPQYTLTIIASPTNAGNVNLNNGEWTNQSSITVEEITDFELQATSTEGYYFSRWYRGEEEISTLSDFTYTLENDCTLTAKFMTEPETVEMVTVPSGTFTMGDTWGNGYPDEKPAHAVEITHDFFMGKYEIQNDQFLEFLMDQDIPASGELYGHKVINTDSDHNEFIYTGNAYALKTPGKETFPAMEITWWGAIYYCNWLSEKEGLSKAYDNEGNLLDGNDNQTRDISKIEGYRLPTEAEWEYAARGAEQQDRSNEEYVFAGGNDLEEVGFFCFNSTNDDYPIVYESFIVKETDNYYHTTRSMGTHQVGQKKPNNLDLHDMSGNVWEWCYDYYACEYYTDIRTINPVGPSKEELVYIEWEREEPRVIRGGSFHSYDQYCENSFRMTDHPGYQLIGIGFRIARTK